MISEDINKALKRWGDPEAAKRGTGKRVFGGHGNGGKFYMRQMFKQSLFITYRDGKLNVFGFNKNRRYGFAEGFKDKNVSPDNAMKFAEIYDMDLPPNIRKDILKGNVGFTVARGISPNKINKRKFNLGKLCEKFKQYPQARLILKYKPVSIINNEIIFNPHLLPEEILPMPEFEKPVEIPIPLILEDPEDDCVKNDRSTLNEYVITKALRKWIGEQIDKLAEKIEEKEKKEIRQESMLNIL